MATTSRRPRPHQRAALRALRATLTTAATGCARAQLVMACGTGKTLVGRWHAQAVEARRVLVVLPSLALVAQTLAEWRQAGDGWVFDPLVVCSDPTTGHGTHPAERAELDEVDALGGIDVQVSTNPAVVGRFLDRARRRPRVVFATYHSAPVLAQACAATGTVLDLVLADEAHRLAGSPDPRFRLVLDDDAIPARQRVFMTATPVHAVRRQRQGWDDWASSTSMADEEVFGPVAYRLGFAEAIAAGLLCDYQVLVVDAAADSDYGPGRASAVDAVAGRRVGTGPAAALLAAAGRWGLTRVLSFHGRIGKARALAVALDGAELADGRRVQAVTVSGADPTSARTRALQQLQDVPADRCVVVTNARCLGEGVNVPAVDGILFADPKTSEVDIVQAIGRAVRPAAGKTRGLIVVPVDVGDEPVDDDTALSAGPFAAVWLVLKALRKVDDRVGTGLDAVVRDGARRGRGDGSRPIPQVVFDLPDRVDLDRLRTRLADATGSGWEAFFADLLAHVAETGTADPPRGGRLGLWCERQRAAHRSGTLPADRAGRLADLPGWVWDHGTRLWLDQWAQVAAAAAQAGAAPVDGDLATVRLDRRRRARAAARTLGQWCAQQRMAERRGELDAEQRSRCEQILGWRWRTVLDEDAAAVDQLGEWVAWKDDANPPSDCVEDDIELGRWLNRQRRCRQVGTLTQPLLDEITVAASLAAVALRWEPRAVQWYLGLQAARAFAARTGHCRVPDGHVEALVDTDVQLHVWCRRQRHERRLGRLDPARTAALEALPGWRWEVQPAPRVRMDVGDARHGTRTGYVNGCRCTARTAANRTDAAEREARRRCGEVECDWVNAARARGHLRILHGQGASRDAIGRATGLSTKTIDGLLDGATRRILPSTQEAVLALGMTHVRRAAKPGTRVDAAPTWRLIETMVRLGWPKAWIAAEIGHGRALQLGRVSVSAENARKVADLARRVGDLRCPGRYGGKAGATPPLARILSQNAIEAADGAEGGAVVAEDGAA